MKLTTCGKCSGTGKFYYTSIYGRGCFRCNGTGLAPERKKATPKARTLPATVKIASLCGGDPTKLDPSNERALSYLGLTADKLAEYAEMWRQGVREVPRIAA
jgi:hypothetical protein